MDPDELREKLKEQPFEPFEVVMTNGDRFSVRHSEMAHLTVDTLYVFRDIDAEREIAVGPSIRCAVVNISTLEPLPEKKAS
ncbi:MAG: hypothetical protein AAF800_08005 [Planctomycetota bacterium]